MRIRTLNRVLVGVAVLAAVGLTIVGQNKPAIDYTMRIDPADLSTVGVRVSIHGAPAGLRVAMAAHPEYDDKYWRYIEDLRAESGGSTLTLTKLEDTLWQIDGSRGSVSISYRVRLPEQPTPRAAWKPFLTPTGGMVGDLHMLMYVVGEETRLARLTLDMPKGWKAASGLAATADSRVFTGTTELLLDAPVMVGDLRVWEFTVAGVPHQVVIWPDPNGKPYDAEPLVEGVKRLAEQAVKAFGPPPYPRYTFMFPDASQAALEHMTSVSIGLSHDISDLYEEIAHEYSHVWNLMDVRPRERVGVKYRFAEPTGVLWWNEGATIMFADLLIRRAGLVGDKRTRLDRLASRLSIFLNSPGYSNLSAEQVSRGDSHPRLLGDNATSTHLQGEVLTTLLDLKIRDATNATRDATDVMRLLAQRFDWHRGITNDDIERAVTDVCRCNVADFFQQQIRGAQRPDFDKYLALIGMRHEVTWSTAIGPDGNPAVDLRVVPLSGETDLVLRVTNPESAWAQAGLHTGDKLVSVEGRPVDNWQGFRQWLRTLKVGDRPHLVVSRDGVSKNITVELKPFEIPTVKLIELPNATARQLKLRDKWVNSN